MYVSSNLYQKEAFYDSDKDYDFIHKSILVAKKNFELNKDVELDNEQVEKLKKQSTPIMYCSTVKSFKKSNDSVISREELMTRLSQRFIVIDADFNNGEEDESENLRVKCIKLSEQYDCKLIIYPTASYPFKPRFRAIFFVKRTMGNDEYFKAATWLFEKLEYKVTDINDFRIRNTNLPYFTDESQLDFIYDNSQDKLKTTLDNKLWSEYEGRVIKSKKIFDPSPLDKISFNDKSIKQLVESVIDSGIADEYNTFWPFINSLVRAHYFEQISDEGITTILEDVAEIGEDVIEKMRWKKENKTLYEKTKMKLLNDEDKLFASKPIIRYLDN